jgi:ABC-2 type transport system permease protein
MNPVIARITLRQLLSRRRTALLLLLGGIMVLVAIALRLSLDDVYLQEYTAALLNNFGVATLMPLVALLFGTGAIGGELEDGTAVYLLAKPVNRWTILITKLVVASGASIALACVPIFAAGLIVDGGLSDGLVLGFTFAAAIGSIVYCAIFVALSLVTGRALVFGLGYVLIWEGLLSGLFAGTRTFSVRQETLALADAIADVPSGVFEAQLGLAPALIVGGVVLVGATLLAGRRLINIEIAGESA